MSTLARIFAPRRLLGIGRELAWPRKRWGKIVYHSVVDLGVIAAMGGL